ncbi:hypothetical protein [Weissella jogaejeotgali]|uniref:hypothetical protein n=1 Tax=Weissella jogaejeotgali TaxID=1631871 RepID=UPI0012EBE849|nr:hypothetical protein [Weissella jogaejeotgali]
MEYTSLINAQNIGELITELQKLDPKTKINYEYARIEVLKNIYTGKQVLRIGELN